MISKKSSRADLLAENERLRLALEEAQECLGGIGRGEVDAFVVCGADGNRVISLEGAEEPYRMLVESMNEGAATLAGDGSILYCNNNLAALLGTRPELLIGVPLSQYLVFSDHDLFRALLKTDGPKCARKEVTMTSASGGPLPVLISTCALELAERRILSVIVTDLTRQKQTEGIVASEQLARSIIDQVAEAIVVCNEEGVVIRASQLAQKLCGVNPLWKPFDQLFRLRIIASQAYFSVSAPLGGARLTNTEARLVRPDAVTACLLLNAAPLTAGDRIIGCVVALSDITGLRRTEQALLDSVKLYRSLFENLLNGFAYCRMLIENGIPQDFTYLATNAAFESQTGLRGVDGKKASEVIPGIRESDPQIFEIYHRVAVTGQPERFERYVEALQMWVSVSVYSPAPEHFVALFDVITERKRLEAFREMSREVLQLLNEPGDLQYVIPRILGVLKSRTGFDAIGVRLQNGEDYPYFAQEGFPPEFLQTENTLLDHAEDGELCREADGSFSLACGCGMVLSGKGSDDTHALTPGGSIWTNDSLPNLEVPPEEDQRNRPRNRCIHDGYASVALVPIRSSGRIVGLIQFNDRRKERFTLDTIEILEGVASHIGGALMRKRAEDEKAKLETQLQQAQKMESVGLLAGGVAHDFNNMLSVILGHVNLALIDICPTEPLHVNMEEIRKAAERSADLTRQLLAFARKQTVVPRVLDLNQTVSGTLQMLKRLIGEEVVLKWRPGDDLWQVKMDPSQIDQMLANLCVNARDSIAGVGSIVIETGNFSLSDAYCTVHGGFVPGEYVRLTVSDDGCGMNEETVPRIFEPFFTTKGVGEGTGLGLSTVYGAVRQNSGFINVYSEPGLGTTFSIYLPKHLDPAGREPAGSPSAWVPRGSETILLVEDEPAILEITTMILIRQGYTVLPAGTPGKALTLAMEHSGIIDLLVTDVVLPEMNGLELAKKLVGSIPQLKYLFMSGYPADVIAHRGLVDEGLHFIQKPFSLPNFAVKVRDALDSGVNFISS